MLELEIEKRVKGKACIVWDVLANTEFYNDILPNISHVETISKNQKGMTRNIHYHNGDSWKEECIEWETNSHFTMQIDTKNYFLPVNFIRYTIYMQQKRNIILLKISYEYIPKHGALGTLLNKYQIKPILDILSTQILNILAKKIYYQNKDISITAETILDNKKQKALTVTPEILVAKACEILSEKHVGCLVVINDENKIMGILSERDIIHGLTNKTQSIQNQAVSKFMKKDVIVCRIDDSISDLMSKMSKNHIRNLPVIDSKEHLIGLISISDIVNARLYELDQETAANQQYIEGLKWREAAMLIGRGAASSRA